MLFRVPSSSSVSSVGSVADARTDTEWPEHLCCPITGAPFREPFSITVGGELRTYEKDDLLRWFRVLEEQNVHLRDPLSNLAIRGMDGRPARHAEDVAMYPNRSVLEAVNVRRERAGLPPLEIVRSQLWAPTVAASVPVPGANNAFVVDADAPLVRRFRRQVFVASAVTGLTSLLTTGVGVKALGTIGLGGDSKDGPAAAAAVGGALLGGIWGFFTRGDGRGLSGRHWAALYVGVEAAAGLIGASLLRAHARVDVDPLEAAASSALGASLVLLVGRAAASLLARALPLLARALPRDEELE